MYMAIQACPNAVVDFSPRSAGNFVVCYDVLQYLDDNAAANAPRAARRSLVRYASFKLQAITWPRLGALWNGWISPLDCTRSGLRHSWLRANLTAKPHAGDVFLYRAGAQGLPESEYRHD